MASRTGCAAAWFVALVIAAVIAPCACADEPFVEQPWEARLNRKQPPVVVMDAIGLEPGMTIAEVGAGTGRYTVWLADRVGPEGLVLANDIDAEALEQLAARCRRLQLGQVETHLGAVDDPKLPRGASDVVFMINVYHHLERPVDLVRRLAPVLRVGGRLAIVEHCPVKTGRTSGHATARDRMEAELGEAGFEVVEVLDLLEEDLIYLARPVAPAA